MKIMQTLLVVVAAATVVAGCAERAAPTAPRMLSFQSVNAANPATPIAFTIVNPCNGELVDLVGSLEVQFKNHMDGSGGFHATTRIIERGKGTGESSGAGYGFSEDSSIVFNGRTIHEAVSEHVAFRVVAQGQVPNFFLTQLLHFTVTPNGDLVGLVDNFTAECR